MKEVNQNQKKCCFKSLSSSKIFVALTFLLIGIGATLVTQNIVKAQERHDPFFASLQAMNEMEENMNEIFASHQKHIKEVFEKAAKETDLKSNKSQVVNSEDDSGYYYELNFSGFKKEDISVEFKDRILSFSAKKTEDKNQNFSSFSYSFLAEKSDTTKAPEIVKLDDKIVVKIHKKKTKS